MKSGASYGDVLILVDAPTWRPTKVREGDWSVRELKAAVGVDPAKVLAEIAPLGLVDLDDNSSIIVRDGMRFMTHVRSGGSS